MFKATMSVSSYALACPSTPQNKVDREQEGLLGPVREVWLRRLRSVKMAWLFPIERRMPLRLTSFNERGNKTEVVSYEPAHQKVTETYKYDLSGRKIERSIKQGSILTKTLYYYDAEAGRIESIEKVTDGKHSVTRRYASIFDKKGNQVKAIYSDDSIAEISASYRYEFDDEGRLATIETYDSNETVNHKIVCSYDLSGRLSQKSWYGLTKGEYERRVFAYGPNGRTEQRLTFDRTASLERQIVYRYDERNNLVEVAGYDSHRSLVGRTSHTLQFDDVGNWIQRVSQTGDPRKPTAEWVEFQVITYADEL